MAHQLSPSKPSRKCARCDKANTNVQFKTGNLQVILCDSCLTTWYKQLDTYTKDEFPKFLKNG